MFTGFIIFMLIILAFLGSFFFGLNYYSNGKVYGDERKRNFVKKLIMLPFGIFIAYILLFYLFQEILFKPNLNEIIGEYEISDVNNIEIEKSNYQKHNLELKSNGEYNFKNKPNIEICERGIYNLYETGNKTEINFKCMNGNSSAKIINNLWSFEIEFIIGDPDSGENISYKKIEN
jgi:hypothetical protein